MKKLILFIHGLGGNDQTWGKFPEIIANDEELKDFDIKIYTYPTHIITWTTVIKELIRPISSILSFLIPPSKLPSIQDIAKVLKSDIENRYRDYDTIDLVTHSMGGLIAKKYLLDIISSKNTHNIKVNKLLLYAVPNHGSNWAILSKLYNNNKQIAQLSKNSDFIESLNTDIANSNLNNYVFTKYVIASLDEIVDKQSAQNEYGNTNQEMVHCGHMDIVKPENSEDLSYIIFKNYILDDNLFENNININTGLSNENVSFLLKTILSQLDTIKDNQKNTNKQISGLIEEVKE